MRKVMLLAVVLSIVVPLRPVIDAAQSQPPRSTESIKEEVVVATRILFDSGFLDTAGHVSVRLDANRFLMPWRRAPELVVADDLMEYDLDGRVADARGRALVLERFIHAEIYRARPDVTAVVHGHTPSLLLFSSSNIPLRPLFAGAGFIGQQVPTFKNGDAGGGVNNAELGRGLAHALGKSNAVLMRGHGVVVVASSAVALIAQLLAMGDKEPMYIKPNPDAGGGGGGGDNAREWEAYKRRAEALMKR